MDISRSSKDPDLLHDVLSVKARGPDAEASVTLFAMRVLSLDVYMGVL